MKYIATLLFCCLFLSSLQAQMTPVDLTCELQTTPQTIDTPTPRFAWKLVSDAQGDKQTAYQIRIVTALDGQPVWDSGKKKSSESQFIPYSGKKALLPGVAYRWCVLVWDAKGKKTESEWQTFGLAPDMSQSKAQWIGAITREDAHLPMGRRDLASPSFKNTEHKALFDAVNPLALKSINLRRSFILGKEIKQASLSVSGLGHYNLSINGRCVTRDVFTPLWSDYDKTVYYNTYEVDSLLLIGENAIGVTLGNGFYNAVGSRYRKLWISFGPPTLFLEMKVDYTDGTSETITSDPAWKYSLSPIQFNDIYGGEDYDARLEQPGWDAPGFDAASWQPVVVQNPPQGKLRPQQLSPVRIMEEFAPQTMNKVDSVYVFDMGQNLSGFPAIKVSGKAGQTIRLVVGEQLDKTTGRVSQKQSGGPHTYTYTLRGDEVETWRPEFSYYGFRYIQVEGASVLTREDNKPFLLELNSQFIYNSTASNGSFESSNELFNQAHTLIRNAMKSNMQAVFTDCPHREKLGWLEQTQLVGPGLLYNWNMTQFYPKIMQDIADAQLSNGMVPTTAPEFAIFQEPYDMFRDSPEWGIASIMIPWLYYKFYGDNSLLVQYYEVMKRYVDYLTS
ncbi:family 78 glycoside hydrolase catalytic domain, partial [Bacteroidales bacterium OttesenSCG-928-L03]|nr:family 78 glycoside hydrolase catalytic domain [Bacteroidales bacterium OttesenSCG-928-L03]